MDSPTLTTWLLDADPSLRWQVLQDLVGAPSELVAGERALVAAVGHGARLLSLQAEDGTWGGAAWNRDGTSTMHVLTLLREMGIDREDARVRRALASVRDLVTWRGCGPAECASHRFFEGELETCINAQVVASGEYFGQDVRGVVDRLLGEQLEDGGWNCQAPSRSRRSSFDTTICVLEALIEHERTSGPREVVRVALARGIGYLLERRFLRRKSTGEIIARDRKSGADWREFGWPTWWNYDVLRGLECLRRAGTVPDERCAEAVELLRAKRGEDGLWALDVDRGKALPVALDAGAGRASRWVTLRALRVLRWSLEA